MSPFTNSLKCQGPLWTENNRDNYSLTTDISVQQVIGQVKQIVPSYVLSEERSSSTAGS